MGHENSEGIGDFPQKAVQIPSPIQDQATSVSLDSMKDSLHLLRAKTFIYDCYSSLTESSGFFLRSVVVLESASNRKEVLS